ncbi:Uncharacterized [Syntrophomonas zehnderi OL-4]|uniref:Uncharacterized n=1 Tax=Syntrophomonas zehnderi OL-4 TaxID=690567 RepID=A0A0E4C8L7_9FIRM|nr:hypothetical protein [Syntrophomonas zehnderi]CFX56502.1 Uncharacterized [Syntrophomonas zehnderi OL-4]
MRTLVATTLVNSKGKEIYCTAKKITDKHMEYIRNLSRQELEDIGFVFIKMISLEFPNVKGHAIFFEGHVDDIMPALKSLQVKY